MSAPAAGRIVFVGAGPGAPDLITLRGARVIADADVVVWASSLVSPEIIADRRPDAEVVDSASASLEDLIPLLERARDEGLLIARVHTGDPSIYGATAEQRALCRRLGLAYETIPGVSAFSAAAASAEVEITLPEVAQSLILTRLEGGRTPMPARESVRAFARHGTTMALYLSAARNRALQEELLAGGYPPDTPVIIGHRVSWPDEVLLRCRLDELSATMKDHRFFKHTVILVGPALADADPEHRSHLYHPGFRHGYRAADPDSARALRESGAVVEVGSLRSRFAATSSTGVEGSVSTSSTGVEGSVSTSSTSDEGSITVYGYAGRPGADLRAAAASATLVVGGRRHLDALGVPDDRRLELGPVAPAVDALAALPPDADAIVVASGDPLFYGVVRRLRRAGLRVRVIPTVTSLQLAFAAVALPWDDALLVSLHGNDPSPGLAACRTHPKVGVLTDPTTGFAEVVRATAGLGRTYVLAERLGEDDERVRVLSGADALAVTDVAQPHVVLVLAHHPDDPGALGVQHPIAGGVRPDPEVPA